MAIPYPDDPALQGGFAPLRMECDAPDLVVEGSIPRELCGVFYRNGPNPQYAPRGHYHWFGGDGMIHAFQFEDGRVSYRNRYVRTKKWRLEHTAHRSLVAIFDAQNHDPGVRGVVTDGVANTNIVCHAGRLLALEEAHSPIEIQSGSLETLGPFDFAGKLSGPMTAHPRIDPETGEMLFFAYNADGRVSTRIAFHVADSKGNLVRSETFDAPYPSMIHDFCVTREHVIFPVMPLTGSAERAAAGGPVYAWEADRPSCIGIMPRDGSAADIRWFLGEAAYVFHFMNAWTEGDRVICDVCEFERAPMFPAVDGTLPDPVRTLPRLTRWTFALNESEDRFSKERLSDTVCEFPRLDERFAGLANRFGYTVCDTRPANRVGSFDAIARVDLISGNWDTHPVGPMSATNEAVFVPRTPDAPEGDGFLLANVYDANRDASRLLVLDAGDVSAGPIATAWLDHRIPFGFHGNWVPTGSDSITRPGGLN